MKKLVLLASLIIAANLSFGQFIQNGSFTNWQVENLYSFPNSWVINLEHGNPGLQEKVTDAQEGNYAIRLNTVNTQNGSDFGYLFYGYPSDKKLTGLPFTLIADTVRFWYKANIEPGDEAMAMAILYAGGVTIDSIVVPINTSAGDWTPMAIGINPGHVQPDSLFFGFLSTNPFSGNPVAGTWLMVDNVYFTNGPDTTHLYPIPNSSFETWTDVVAENPVNWSTSNGDLLLALNDTFTVSKTTDYFSAPYAAKLSVVEIDGNQAQSEMLYIDNNFTYQPQNFSFYYKYQPVGNDNANVNVNFYNGNNQIGHWNTNINDQDAMYKMVNVSSELNINGTPDRVEIKFSAGNNAGSTLYIDDVAFGYGSSCIPVHNLNVQNITTNSAQISWQASNNETSWQLKYGFAGFDTQSQDTSICKTINGLTTPGYNLNNVLSNGSTYDVYVKADCGSGVLSAWAKVTFRTVCLISSAPISEDFESTNDNNIPNCWNAIIQNGAGVQVVNWGQSTSGSKSLRMQWSNSNSKTFLISPEISNSLSQLFISFNARANSQGSPYITVGTMSDPNDENTFSPLTTYQINPNYQNYTYYLKNYTGSDHYLAFRLTGNNQNYSEILIDDILINFTPSCIPVQNLNAQNITVNSAEITWQPGDNETLWNLKYRLSNVDTITNLPVIVNGLTGTSYSINNVLNSGTMYDVFVQADCGGGDLSTRTKVTFTTLCQTYSVPVSENFESTPENTVPHCWNAIIRNDAAVNVVNWWQSTSGSKSMRMYRGNSISSTYLITPELSNPLNQLALSFNAKAQSTNQPIIIIGTMSNPNNDSTFSPLTSFQISPNYENFTYLFNNYSGNDPYIAFRLTSNTQNYTETFIDDIYIDYIPSCPKPTALNANNITQTSAYLTWTAGLSEVQWNIEIGNPGFTPGVNNYINNGTAYTNPMWTAQGLNPNEIYQFYIRAVCDTSDLSTWAGPFQFTTPCATYSIPFYEEFNNSWWSIPSCWDRNNTNWFANGSNNAGANAPELFYNSNSYTPGEQRVITPFIDASSANTLMVSFKQALNQNAISQYTIGVEVTTDDVNWTTVWSLSPTTNINPEEVMIDLSSYAHQTIKVAWYFEGGGDSSNVNWHIDNVLIDAMPTCPKPTALNAANITASTADFSWTAGGNETKWNIEVGNPGFTPGVYNYMYQGTAYTTPVWAVQGLNSNTAYQFYVRAVCDTTDLSTWAGPFYFSTIFNCTPITYFPWVEGFEGQEFPPYCWSNIDVDGDGNKWVQKIGWASHSGNKVAASASWESAPLNPNNWLITPQFSINNPNLEFSMWYAGQDPSYISENFSVLISTTGTNPADFTEVFTTVVSSTSFTELVIPLNAYFGQDIYIAIRHWGCTDMYYLKVDDISVRNGLCKDPANLTASNITSTSADLGWGQSGSQGSNPSIILSSIVDTTGSQQRWNVEVGHQGFTPGTGNFVQGVSGTTANPWNVSGLNPQTNYEFYVQAACDTNGVSTWAGPFYFFTSSNCPQVICPDNMNVCSIMNPFELTGATPTGGTYSGPGVDNGTFYPANAYNGTNTIYYTYTNASCYTQCSFTINNYSLIASITANGPTTFCPGGSVTLSANESMASYSWSTTETTQAITVFSAGHYIVTVTDGNGCQNTASIDVTVNQAPVAPTDVMASPSAINCSDNSNLSATSAGNTINWYTNATGGTVLGSSNSGDNFNVAPTVTTTYYAETDSGCGSTTRVPVTVTVTSNIDAATNVITTPSAICEGSTANLNATAPGYNIFWYTSASGGNAIGSSASGVDFPVTPDTTTTYYAESSLSSSGNLTFDYTGGAQTFVVPAGVTSVTLETYGAQGSGGNGGYGGYATGTMSVSPGQVLNVYVGGQTGYNGGGNGWASTIRNGGGASDVRSGGTALANRVIVAGGGGSSSGDSNYKGGDGGGGIAVVSNFIGGGGGQGYGGSGGDGSDNGGTGNTSCHSGGAGGGGLYSGGDPSCNYCYTNTCGTAGALGQGGNGDTWENGYCYNSVGGTSGGGGGYYGGGGTSVGYCGGGGGGGGSSWTGTLANPSFIAGTQSGNGLVIISWNAVGCSSPTRIPVTVNVIPVPTASASSNSPQCESSTLTLTSDGGVSYTWEGPDGFISTDQNPFITNVTIDAAGTYTVTVTAANGCTASGSTDVIINALPTPTASSNSPVCVGSSLYLTSNEGGGNEIISNGGGYHSMISGGGDSYSWTGPNGFTSTDQDPYIDNVTISATGTYIVTVTDGNGCQNTASTDVTVNPIPAAPTNVMATPSAIYCSDTSKLSATSAGNMIFWYTDASGGTSIGSSNSGDNFNVTPLITTTYYAETDSACASATRIPVTVTVTSNVVAPTNVTATPPLVCAGNTTNLNATATGDQIFWYTSATGGTAIGFSARV